MVEILTAVLWVAAALAGLWLAAEVAVRVTLARPLRTGFYTSIPREVARERQEEIGVRVATGRGWIHLGWIADPDCESYRIEERVDDAWRACGRERFGSHLVRGAGGDYRVWAVPNGGGSRRLLGEVSARAEPGSPPLFLPRVAGPWQLLFRPREHGHYVNDHTIYRDAEGHWRLAGITGPRDGRLDDEKYFAVGVSPDFPPAGGMREDKPVAEFGELAWAPHVIREDGTYHMFWSPHALHQMSSRDGVNWERHRVTLPAPQHKFFRDATVLRVADGQWLLYATARGRYYSQIDVYQSFDLAEWQYIRTALRSARGSERNSPFASMESPSVIPFRGRYYLALTYNNDSFFWPGVLLRFRKWWNAASYNETLIFDSADPYDFGVYRGRGNSPTLLKRLEAHAPEFVHHPERDAWYVTTAGWPWAATLTAGEVAVAPLVWEPAQSVAWPDLAGSP